MIDSLKCWWDEHQMEPVRAGGRCGMMRNRGDYDMDIPIRTVRLKCQRCGHTENSAVSEQWLEEQGLLGEHRQQRLMEYEQ